MFRVKQMMNVVVIIYSNGRILDVPFCIAPISMRRTNLVLTFIATEQANGTRTTAKKVGTFLLGLS